MGFLRALLTGLWALALLPGADGAPLLTSNGITVCLADGDGPQMGQAIGIAQRDRIRLVVGMVTPQAANVDLAPAERLPPDHSAELRAIASAAGVDEQALLRGNLLLDSLCTAVVAMPGPDRPLRVARNMDFFPADLLGPATVVQIWRTPGKHAVASIGWPGFAGVISGINQPGLSACVLQRFQAERPADGIPLAFALRRILETCTSVAAADAAFRAAPPASGHYVLFADRTDACVVWRDGATVQRADPAADWLVIANEPVVDGKATGPRCVHLRKLCAGGSEPQRLRSLLSASYLKGLNAQAMVIEPATRRIDLALGTSFAPAALAPWHAVELGPLLDGGNGEGFTCAPLPASPRLPRYDH